MEAKRVSAPMTREVSDALRAGDAVLISGVVYTARDAKRTMELFERVKFDDVVDVAPGVRARFWTAILVSSSARGSSPSGPGRLSPIPRRC